MRELAGRKLLNGTPVCGAFLQAGLSSSLGVRAGPHPTSLLDVGGHRDLQVAFSLPGTPGERSTEAEGTTSTPCDLLSFIFLLFHVRVGCCCCWGGGGVSDRWWRGGSPKTHVALLDSS